MDWHCHRPAQSDHSQLRDMLWHDLIPPVNVVPTGQRHRLSHPKRIREHCAAAQSPSHLLRNAPQGPAADSCEHCLQVLPGGKIFVYTGLLPETQDQGGLAFVIGHEVRAARILFETIRAVGRCGLKNTASYRVVLLSWCWHRLHTLSPGTRLRKSE